MDIVSDIVIAAYNVKLLESFLYVCLLIEHLVFYVGKSVYLRGLLKRLKQPAYKHTYLFSNLYTKNGCNFVRQLSKQRSWYYHTCLQLIGCYLSELLAFLDIPFMIWRCYQYSA